MCGSMLLLYGPACGHSRLDYPNSGCKKPNCTSLILPYNLLWDKIAEEEPEVCNEDVTTLEQAWRLDEMLRNLRADGHLFRYKRSQTEERFTTILKAVERTDISLYMHLPDSSLKWHFYSMVHPFGRSWNLLKDRGLDPELRAILCKDTAEEEEELLLPRFQALSERLGRTIDVDGPEGGDRGELARMSRNFFHTKDNWRLHESWHCSREEAVNALLTPVSFDELQSEDRDCSICHEQFGDKLAAAEDKLDLPVKLLCEHLFGSACITTWLLVHSSCAMCRREYSSELDWDHSRYIKDNYHIVRNYYEA
ncbi:hypothetical protein V8E51_003457 [Hyaloscypha variabilis]